MDERKLGDVIDIPESFGKEPAETPQAETPAVAQPEASDTPRDDKGRFAPKVEAAAPEQPKPQEPTGVTPPAAVPPAAPNVQPEPGYVPIAALLDTRDKASAYKRQLDEAQARLAAFERQTAEPPPDFFADPDKAFEARFNSRLEQTLNPLQQQLVETRSALLEERLIRVAGPDKAAKIEAEIGKAMESGDQSILILSNSLRAKGPAAAKELVDWYDKRTFDPVSTREQIRAELLAELQQQKPAGTPAQAAPVTPPSMAAVANGGAPSRESEVTPKGKFEEMFNR